MPRPPMEHVIVTGFGSVSTIDPIIWGLTAGLYRLFRVFTTFNPDDKFQFWTCVLDLARPIMFLRPKL